MQFDSDPSGTPNHKLDDSFARRFAGTGTYSYFCRRLARVLVRVGPNGRRIAFRLTEGAIVLARIQRRTRSGWRSARNFDVFARKDRNRARLPLRGLAPGRYRVRLTAYDDADNASRPAFARLRI